ncbi:hypothetical protein TherJR_0995 [Thermincola potens JR]|uniref:Uncharacterized protein n=1 Tax=Thermincola potens (strain JR) TaxID=635013 RepID=D5XDY9_THEPJ|nr:hypothetical protein TherJR_0995 [Thermincola potens JR]
MTVLNHVKPWFCFFYAKNSLPVLNNIDIFVEKRVFIANVEILYNSRVNIPARILGKICRQVCSRCFPFEAVSLWKEVICRVQY